jgi:hypothetical protein
VNKYRWDRYALPGKFAMMRDIKENDNKIRELINMREHGDGLSNGDEIEQLLYYLCTN